MKKATLCIAAFSTLSGCDVFSDFLNGLANVAEQEYANPIYAYTTIRFQENSETSGLVVAHIGADNHTLERWKVLNTAFAGGNFSISRDLVFSPDHAHVALSLYLPFNGFAENCFESDCAVSIYDSRTGSVTFQMTDNGAGTRVGSYCPPPTPSSQAQAAFDDLLASEAAFAAEEGIPDSYAGATISVIPFSQAGALSGPDAPTPETIQGITSEELDFEGWTSATDFVTIYTSGDPHFITKVDGSREVFVDNVQNSGQIFETRTTRYLRQDVTGNVTACSFDEIPVQSIPVPVRDVTHETIELQPRETNSDALRSIDVFSADGQSMVQVFNTDNRYRTTVNTQVDLTAGPYNHTLAP